MSDREAAGTTMNMATMRLAYNADGGPVYKPIMPPSSTTTTETYHQQNSQPPIEDVSLYHHQQQQQQQQEQGNSVGFSSGTGEPAKRKRGRPRKYSPDGNNGNNSHVMGLNLTSPPPPPLAVASSASNSTKKARGRPPGSSSARKQHSAALGNYLSLYIYKQYRYSYFIIYMLVFLSFSRSTGSGFTPHVITVQPGDDVLAKVMLFSQNGSRAVCILSANGAISNVTLRQAMTSGGTVTYEGRFEILSLSGSILLSENGGQRSRTGGLSVSLAGPDGRVLGGGVAGLLTAASPVQVIMGTFLTEGWKETRSSGMQSEPLSYTPNLIQRGSTAGSPPSRGNLSESSGGGPGSPLNHSTGGCSNNNPPLMTNIPWK
ncbi:hypothetical protein EZV62_013824 [Acer yangbiense]|uniref:AT-hook motif nuclear-localized protein n=1 Tax=Acer yangbiense TaxID=1000413 RepID=A0A5C7HQC6_9ROSI|nr:hypothetical protein EZV62_013824 [Acer yangbiense]